MNFLSSTFRKFRSWTPSFLQTKTTGDDGDTVVGEVDMAVELELTSTLQRTIENPDAQIRPVPGNKQPTGLFHTDSISVEEERLMASSASNMASDRRELGYESSVREQSNALQTTPLHAQWVSDPRSSEFHRSYPKQAYVNRLQTPERVTSFSAESYSIPYEGQVYTPTPRVRKPVLYVEEETRDIYPTQTYTPTPRVRKPVLYVEEEPRDIYPTQTYTSTPRVRKPVLYNDEESAPYLSQVQQTWPEYDSTGREAYYTPVGQVDTEPRNSNSYSYYTAPQQQTPSPIVRSEVGQSNPPSYHTVAQRVPSRRQESLPYNGPARKAMFPETFDGTGDWEEYLTHFEGVADWNGWDSEEKATQLGLHLKGIARSVKTDMPLSTTSNYELLVPTLAKYFSSEGKEAAYQAELRQKRRGKDEKLMDYGHELTRLCKKAFPRMDRSAREQFVLEHFKSGLDSELRKHVQFQHPNSVEEAVIAGLEYEAMDESRLRAKKPVAVNTLQAQSASNSSPADSSILQAIGFAEKSMQASQKMAEQMQRMFEQMQRPGLGRDFSNYVCYSCNEKGHTQYNCPKYPKPAKGQAKSGPAGTSKPGN